MAAAPWIVSDELWELIEPLLPRKGRRFRYRVASVCLIARRYRESSSSCTPASPGSTCPPNSASALA
jgi:hypothetical protein